MMDAAEHNVRAPSRHDQFYLLLLLLEKERSFTVLLVDRSLLGWLLAWLLAGDRDRGGGGGAREALLRRVPHHRDAHVARRADGAQGELISLPSDPTPSSSLFFLALSGDDRSSRS